MNNWNMSSMTNDNSVNGSSQMSTRSTWSSNTRPTTSTSSTTTTTLDNNNYNQYHQYYNKIQNQQQQQGSLSIFNQDVTKKVEILSKIMQETLAENNNIEKDIINLLKYIEIDPQSLSYETNTGLEKAGIILKKNNMIMFNDNNLVINMENDKYNKIINTRNDRNLKKIYENLCIKYTKIQDKLLKIQNKVQYIIDIIDNERDNSELQYSQTIQNQTKLNDYKRIIDNLDKELIEMNINNDGPDGILKKYNYFMGATGELAELTKSLNYYNNLPPDIRQAKAVVEQTEKKRQQVKYLLDKKMGK